MDGVDWLRREERLPGQVGGHDDGARQCGVLVNVGRRYRRRHQGRGGRRLRAVRSLARRDWRGIGLGGLDRVALEADVVATGSLHAAGGQQVAANNREGDERPQRLMSTWDSRLTDHDGVPGTFGAMAAYSIRTRARREKQGILSPQ